MSSRHGFFPDIAMEDYHGSSEVSSTNLRDAESSVALGIFKQRNPPPQTQAMINGTAGHLCIQDMDTFLCTYVPAPQGIDRRTKAGKTEWSEFLDATADRTVLDHHIFEGCLRAHEQVWTHPEARLLLDHSEFEVSGYAEVEGLPVKARPDADITGDLMDLLDIKTRQLGAASRDAWLRDFINWKIYLQAGLQIEVWRALGRDVSAYWYLLVELDAPFQCNLLTLDDEWLAVASSEARGACRRWKAWLDDRGTDSTGSGYPTGQAPLEVPAWLRRKLEDGDGDNGFAVV